MRGSRRLPAFTLIEVLVVVGIIAVLLAILLPSLRAARGEARAAVCGSNLHTISQTLVGWMAETNSSRIPAVTGWVSWVLKASKGEAGIFTCPEDKTPFPLAALFAMQRDSTLPEKDRTLSLDGGLCRRQQIKTDPTQYQVGGEGAQDFDYDDVKFNYRATDPGQATTDVTMIETDVHSWSILSFRGRSVIPVSDTSSGQAFNTTLLWGSYGMNLSVGLQRVYPNMIMLLDHYDWIADMEDLTSNGKSIEARIVQFRSDPLLTFWQSSDTFVARRHADRANVSFLDGSVRRLNRAALHCEHPVVSNGRLTQLCPGIWHPARPVDVTDNNWKGRMKPRLPWY